MAIEDAFLHDILAHPDDDAPRLIYADWLDEHNDPRGEFIRVQCALAQLSDEDPHRWPLEQREQELLHEYESKLLPKTISNTPCVFRRGFVEEIALSPEEYLLNADQLFEQMPIRTLHLHRSGWVRIEHYEGSLGQVAASRHLARIRSLRLTDLSLSLHELHDLLASPALEQLTDLHLSRLSVENEGNLNRGPNPPPVDLVHDFTHLPCHANLRALHLDHRTLTLDALRVLANSSSLPNLRELNLNDNRLTHEAVTILAEGRLLSQLETLYLDSNLLGDAGALTFREWPALPRLARLSLGHNQIFPEGVQALAEALALRELISLDLFGNISCDDGASDLASSDWTRLQALNLRFNGVGDKGVRALAHSETLSQLTRLNLTANRITSDGSRALKESPCLPRSVRLDLLRNDIAATEQDELRKRFGPFVYFWPLAD